MSTRRRSKRKRPDAGDLADQLRAAFAETGISRFELARRSGMAYAIVFRFVSEHADIRLSTASKLAETLRLRLTEIDES